MGRNKVTHTYELVKAYGSGSQVTYNLDQRLWQRKEPIAIKHAREISINPFTEAKSTGDQLANQLRGVDHQIVDGSLEYENIEYNK